MYGAILGDIVGSPYEFDCNNYKGKDFPLFSQRSEFTDDTVMTLAVARALLDTRGQDDITIKAALVREMQRLGRAYPDKGYGARFNQWLYEDDPQPYRSYGNGSAMRVSPAAWLAESIQEALHLARLYGCKAAVLKERSPSCGSGNIYDGTFSGCLTPGDGVTAALLKENGITVYGESEIEMLLSQAEPEEPQQSLF